MVPGDTETAPNGTFFQQKTFAGLLPPGEIVSLAIVYDEGDDFGFPCPDPGNSCVHLDDIRVGSHLWTSASDNGNNQTIEAAPTGTAFLEELFGEPLEAVLAGS